MDLIGIAIRGRERYHYATALTNFPVFETVLNFNPLLDGISATVTKNYQIIQTYLLIRISTMFLHIDGFMSVLGHDISSKLHSFSDHSRVRVQTKEFIPGGGIHSNAWFLYLTVLVL